MATTIPTITILYASETGCSTDVARRMNRELRRLGFNTQLSIMDHYPIDKLPSEQFVLFICSTTGQGQTPENMVQFWNFLLRTDLPTTSLKNINYSIFGLGDTAYPLYNAVARRLDKRLRSLGATDFSPIGLGDDQHPMGYDGGLILWQLELLKSLKEQIRTLLEEPTITTSAALTQIQTNVELAYESSKSSLADAPTSTPITDAMTDQPSAINSVDDNNNIQINSNNNNNNNNNLSKIDYLAFSSAAITMIPHNTFTLDELDMIDDSPGLGEMIYKAIVFPSLPQIKPLLLDTSNTTALELLTNPTQDLIGAIVDLFKAYIGVGIEYVPGTVHCDDLGTHHPESYHQFPTSDDIFSFDKIYEALKPFLFPANDSTQQHNTQYPSHSTKNQLSSCYKPLNVVSTTRLTASNHYQDVNHIQYDLTPLLTVPPETTSTTTTTTTNPPIPSSQLDHFSSLITNPPYLPGDVLEVIPPTPNVLVNSLLTLYNLHPNDLLFITDTPPHLPKPHTILDNGTPHYTLYNTADGLFDFLLGHLEKQFELDDELESSPENQPKMSNIGSFSSNLSLRRFESFPLCIRAWELFTWYINVNFTPQRHHFFLLAQQSSSPSEKERLTDLCSASYASVLDSYCIRERRSITEVFCDFPTSVWPLYWLVEMCDRIKPRQFSLASAPAYGAIPGVESVPSADWFIDTARPFKIGPTPTSALTTFAIPTTPLLTGSLCLATVKYTTPFKRQKFGLCSTYLDQVSQFSQNCALHKHSPDLTQKSPNTPQYYDSRDDGYTINYPIRADLLPTKTPSSPSDSNTGSALVANPTIPNTHNINGQMRQNLIDLNRNGHISSNTSVQRIMARVKPGSFRYNLDQYKIDRTPVLAIGPGTGVAALHSMVEHRFAHAFYNFVLSQNNNSITFLDAFRHALSPSIETIRTLSQSSQFDQRVVFTTNTINNDRNNTTIPALNILTSPLQLDHHLHPLSLVFGCRSSIGDHFYRDFFNFAVNVGILDQYHAVFSRNAVNPELSPSLYNQVATSLSQNNIKLTDSLISNREINTSSEDDSTEIIAKMGSIDKYVQDRLRSNSKLGQFLIDIVDIQYSPLQFNTTTTTAVDNDNSQQHHNIQNNDPKLTKIGINLDVPITGGRIIVAGNAKKMPVDVNNTIVDIIWDEIQTSKMTTDPSDGIESYNVTRSDVKKYVNIMAKRGRYILECWM